ncbi:unnamed protein product [Trichogramma brassicae]|uniref:Reverse transcriptase domain-containing protein n=1 Tax=Trichogramma brassicae TaxID=86971 RepID=A0A6H5I280_9HYME|nr:unnamed protein product [Trichogramma brassicae]
MDDAVMVRCTGGQARLPTSGTHACEREGLPTEQVVNQMKTPAERSMPPQDISCALLSRRTSAEAVSGKRWKHGTKKYCVVVTLDVKNAFNSARWNNIHAVLYQMRMPDYMLRIIGSHLSARILDYDKDDGPESYRVTAGVPQGSVLGPFLWNFMYDAVLRLNFGGNVKIVGFADDIALVAAAKHLGQIEYELNSAIEWIR